MPCPQQYCTYTRHTMLSSFAVTPRPSELTTLSPPATSCWKLRRALPSTCMFLVGNPVTFIARMRWIWWTDQLQYSGFAVQATQGGSCDDQHVPHMRELINELCWQTISAGASAGTFTECSKSFAKMCYQQAILWHLVLHGHRHGD